MNDLKFVTHFSISTMENIISKTVQDKVEKYLSPTSVKPLHKRSETRIKHLLAKIRKRESLQESKIRKVYIKWKSKYTKYCEKGRILGTAKERWWV